MANAPETALDSRLRGNSMTLDAPIRQVTKSACAAVVEDCLTLRPVHADGVASVPVQGGVAYLVKDAHADGCRFCHLDNRTRVPFIEEIDKRAAGRVALLANLPTGS